MYLCLVRTPDEEAQLPPRLVFTCLLLDMAVSGGQHAPEQTIGMRGREMRCETYIGKRGVLTLNTSRATTDSDGDYQHGDSDSSNKNGLRCCHCRRDLPPSHAHRARRVPSVRSAARRACMRAPCHHKQMRGQSAALRLLRGLRHCGEGLAQHVRGLSVPGRVTYV